MLLTGLLIGSKLFASTLSVQANICGLPTAPIISAPTTGITVSNQTVTVSGTADDNDSVNILDNGQLASSTTADGSGDYGVSISLTSGLNIIVAQAENSCDQTANSSDVSVTFTIPTPPSSPAASQTGSTTSAPVPSATSVATTTTPPAVTTSGSQNTVTITLDNFPNISTSSNTGSTTSSPSSQITQTTKNSYFISGTIGQAANVEVIVNGKVIADIVTDSTGRFSVLIPLKLGVNKIEFVAKVGNQVVSRTISIQRAPYFKKTPKSSSKTLLILYIAIGLAIVCIGYEAIRIAAYRRKNRMDNTK